MNTVSMWNKESLGVYLSHSVQKHNGGVLMSTLTLVQGEVYVAPSSRYAFA
ncbi:hypothetical protein HY212_04605 [Candidatus Pacearchaeota archaeon]|nr:hypothetical protein [Candidatus Pacearchaeota archaeon]